MKLSFKPLRIPNYYPNRGLHTTKAWPTNFHRLQWIEGHAPDEPQPPGFRITSMLEVKNVPLLADWKPLSHSFTIGMRIRLPSCGDCQMILLWICLGSKTARYPPCVLVIWKSSIKSIVAFPSFLDSSGLLQIPCSCAAAIPPTHTESRPTICSAWGKVFWWYSNSWGKWARKAPEATNLLPTDLVISGIVSSYVGWCCLVLSSHSHLESPQVLYTYLEHVSRTIC